MFHCSLPPSAMFTDASGWHYLHVWELSCANSFSGEYFTQNLLPPCRWEWCCRVSLRQNNKACHPGGHYWNDYTAAQSSCKDPSLKSYVGTFCVSSTCYSLQLHIVYNVILYWAGKLWQLCKVLYVFEHKTQYLLIHAPFTRIVVFWHIGNVFCRVKFVVILPRFVLQ